MIIEVHVLQSFPVSNLNRDDLGQPKTAQFGGFTRGRISSQSQKHAARRVFGEYGLRDEHLGIRTKRLRDKVAERLAASHGVDESREAVGIVLEALEFKMVKEGLTEYLLFVGKRAADVLAEHCDDNWDALAKVMAARRKAAEKKTDKTADIKTPARKTYKPGDKVLNALKNSIGAAHAADIGLFGRMVANNQDLSVVAACQVAHAISTHSVTIEFDYFTAMDDLRPDAEPAADMIGTIDFDSACYYRYANTDLDQLKKNLVGDDELPALALNAWLHAFIESVPGGKQSTMAAPTKPDTLLGVVRDKGAWSLANAFLSPVDGERDYMDASSTRLTSHFDKLRGFYGSEQLRQVSFASLEHGPCELADVTNTSTLDEFVDSLLEAAQS